MFGEGKEHVNDKSSDFGLIFVELVREEFPKGPILLRFFTKIRSNFCLILDTFSLDFYLEALKV